MRLLLDANLSPRLLEPLRRAGHEVTHVEDLDLATATASAIIDRATSDCPAHRACSTSGAPT